jgi:pimeloyl-ACP methyl ester carboxylesterase
MLTEKPFDTGELTLNVAEGPDNGAPVVLLHGSTRWWHEWEPAIPLLEPDWHIYAVDLRGHGHSGRGAHYRQADYVRDVDAFIKRGIDQPAVVAGYSLGAVVAILLAAQSPERVRAVVLLDPPIYVKGRDYKLTGETNQWIQFLRQTVTAAPTYDEIIAYMRSMQPDGDPARQDEFARILSLLAPETLDAALRNEMLDAPVLADALLQIRCPTLLVRADPTRGGLIADEDVEYVQTHILNLTVASVAHAAHHELLEPDFRAQTLGAMQTFLNTLTPSPSPSGRGVKLV